MFISETTKKEAASATSLYLLIYQTYFYPEMVQITSVLVTRTRIELVLPP